jgi:hypothetical protein
MHQVTEPGPAYRTRIILNTGPWMMFYHPNRRHSDMLGPYIRSRIAKAFFQYLNEVLDRGTSDIVVDREDLQDEFVAEMIAVLEGSWTSPSGLPMPAEFDPRAVQWIDSVTRLLYQDIVVSIDNSCLVPGTKFTYQRIIGDDILVLYESEYHPLRYATAKQAGTVLRTITYGKDPTPRLEYRWRV